MTGGQAWLILLAGGFVAVNVLCLPVYIAYYRDHPMKILIGLLTLGLFWTGIAWFAALILALWPLKRSETVIDLVLTYEEAPERTKTCARCAERVKATALACRSCGYEFPPDLELSPCSDKDANSEIGGARALPDESFPLSGLILHLFSCPPQDGFDQLRRQEVTP